MSINNVLTFLEHVSENISKVEKFSFGMDKPALFIEEEKQYAIIRAIEIIGEAIKNLPSSITEKYPEIPWKEIAGTRDKLMHHYFGIDLNLIWKIVTEDLPKLKLQIEKIKRELV